MLGAKTTDRKRKVESRPWSGGYRTAIAEYTWR
jgi:hypothetical protein